MSDTDALILLAFRSDARYLNRFARHPDATENDKRFAREATEKYLARLRRYKKAQANDRG